MKSIYFSLFLLFITSSIFSQTKERLAILNLDDSTFGMTSKETNLLLWLTITKMEKFDIVDYYDLKDALKSADVDIEKCNAQSCMQQAGDLLKVDKVLSGSVDEVDNQILINLRLLDIETKTIEKRVTLQYRNIESKVGEMLRLSVQKLFNQPIDRTIFEELSNPSLLEEEQYLSIESLRLSGPRIGLTIFGGSLGDLYEAPESVGGFDANRVMMQVGYQFEIKYYTSKKIQALMEIIPAITGIDQGIVIPSCSFLSGFRDNQEGWEIAAGPIASIVPIKNGQLHSDGFPLPRINFIVGVGKSFRAGKLNIPINIFFIPGQNDTNRFGASMGFNFQG